MTLRGIKCPACGKKGLHYANHPHAQGYKDISAAVCRFCGKRFKLTERNEKQALGEDKK